MHNVQTIVRHVSVPPIVPTSLEQHSILTGDEVTLVDLSNGNMVLILTPANLASGQQFTIKRIDSAQNPSPFEAHISVLTGEAIDTGTRIRLTEPNTAVTLLASTATNNYQVISTLGRIILD